MRCHICDVIRTVPGTDLGLYTHLCCHYPSSRRLCLKRVRKIAVVGFKNFFFFPVRDEVFSAFLM